MRTLYICKHVSSLAFSYPHPLHACSICRLNNVKGYKTQTDRDIALSYKFGNVRDPTILQHSGYAKDRQSYLESDWLTSGVDMQRTFPPELVVKVHPSDALSPSA